MTHFSLETLDRSIYENIRIEVVSRGLAPDIATSVNYLAEAAALPVYIQVVGEGHSESKDGKNSNSIIVSRMGLSPDQLGGGTVKYTKNADGTFTKLRYPDSATMLDYEVRIISKSAKMERLQIGIVLKALGWNKYLPMLAEGGTDFDRRTLLQNKGGVDMSTPDYMEYLFKYTYRDVWLSETVEVLAQDVPKLVDICAGIGVETELDVKTSITPI